MIEPKVPTLNERLANVIKLLSDILDELCDICEAIKKHGKTK